MTPDFNSLMDFIKPTSESELCLLDNGLDHNKGPKYQIECSLTNYVFFFVTDSPPESCGGPLDANGNEVLSLRLGLKHHLYEQV